MGDVERRKASIKEFDRHRVRAAGQDSGEVHAGARDQVPVLHQARGHVPSATGEGQSDSGAVRRRLVAKEVKAQPVGVGQGRAEPAQLDQRAVRSASTEEHSQAGGRRQHRTAADDVLHEQRQVRRNMVFVWRPRRRRSDGRTCFHPATAALEGVAGQRQEPARGTVLQRSQAGSGAVCLGQVGERGSASLRFLRPCKAGEGAARCGFSTLRRSRRGRRPILRQRVQGRNEFAPVGGDHGRAVPHVAAAGRQRVRDVGKRRVRGTPEPGGQIRGTPAQRIGRSGRKGEQPRRFPRRRRRRRAAHRPPRRARWCRRSRRH